MDLDVQAVNFSYGSKHNQVERQFAKDFCKNINIPYFEIDLPFIGTLFQSNLLLSGGEIPSFGYDKKTMSQTVVPGRNGIFLSILAGYAESVGAEAIAIANHSGDHYLYPDCRPDWIEAIKKVVRLGSDGKVELISPFLKLSKAEICRLAFELDVPVVKTWSCYKTTNIHCGVCGTCRERKESFKIAKLEDPTEYLQ